MIVKILLLDSGLLPLTPIFYNNTAELSTIEESLAETLPINLLYTLIHCNTSLKILKINFIFKISISSKADFFNVFIVL